MQTFKSSEYLICIKSISCTVYHYLFMNDIIVQTIVIHAMLLMYLWRSVQILKQSECFVNGLDMF